MLLKHISCQEAAMASCNEAALQKEQRFQTPFCCRASYGTLPAFGLGHECPCGAPAGIGFWVRFIPPIITSFDAPRLEGPLSVFRGPFSRKKRKGEERKEEREKKRREKREKRKHSTHLFFCQLLSTQRASEEGITTFQKAHV